MSDIKYTDEMSEETAEEIIKEIPEGVDEATLAQEEKVSVSKKPKKKYGAKKAIGNNVDVKCSSSNREASYDSETQQLTITQNGTTIMVSPCKTEKQAIRLAAKF
tara:strand:- start:85 stop:399 length:315 start_codon:yes stop_codon:yes gene_type:complete